MNLYFFFNVKILVKKYVCFLVLFEIICIICMINIILKELFSFDNKMIIIFYKILFEDI